MPIRGIIVILAIAACAAFLFRNEIWKFISDFLNEEDKNDTEEK